MKEFGARLNGEQKRNGGGYNFFLPFFKGRSVARCPKPRFLKLIKQREQIYHLQL